MIYITGDTHGSMSLTKLKLLEDITDRDYLIILGDVAIVWHGNTKDQELQKWYKRNLPCKVLFIDGNHDNIVALNNMQIAKWNGGKVHHINGQIIHLMRGQIYNIEGDTYFVFGGGSSVDKKVRTEGISWWPEEMPSQEEYEEGNRSLLKHNNKIDYILTHECPERFMADVIPAWARAQFGNVKPNALNYYFDKLYNKIDFKKWYWGHYHTDIIVNEKCRGFYNDIIEIKTLSTKNEFAQMKEKLYAELKNFVVKDTFTKGKNAGIRKAIVLIDDLIQKLNNKM